MASSRTAPTSAIVALGAAAISIALAGCQRSQPLPAERTLELIKPVARVEVSEAPAAPPPSAPVAEAQAAAQAVPQAPAEPVAVAASPAAPAAPPPQKGTAGGRMVLGEVVFEGAAAALPGDAAATIEAVANYASANPGVRIDIAARAEKGGAGLAKERAQAVRAALLGAGVKEDQVGVGEPAMGDAKAAQRVELLLGAAPASAAAPAAADAGGAKVDGKGIYDKTCVACHSAGVAGAPKLGDKPAWAPRLAGGIGPLVQSALKGKGAMPPKGGNAALTEVEIKAAVEHMVAHSK